ncbi:hypothetical protein ISF_00230 [Cordyceps fumosorosea ARSEF 2679]|uniref:Uncharacterized protein n=1 Tax=Cordyceps fumosorosea (strain ARSEF 2679) TaxID=1081104 RepID=A0A162N013_CORFA|nr:hypothetical protein ISF_00230 [Cordyceps fumosorosea ARSEF 2679]OAA73329.1 hypothetical protein ISF_00230 [Cordyceps fumosorosea ARSEF 2679]
MQFTAVTFLALIAAVVAGPVAPRQADEGNQVTVETPAMTDANGNIVPFDAATVSQPNLDAGL